MLFVCFCENTNLLPRGVLKQALAAASQGFVATTSQQQLQGLFASIDRGNPAAKINAYNGGLFRPDPALDQLKIADAAFDGCLRLSAYDFATDLNVNILGHIFEQSITDLERLRAEIRGEAIDLKKSSRKLGGIFYTPEHINTREESSYHARCTRFPRLLHARHYPRLDRRCRGRRWH